MLNKRNWDVHKFCSKDESRYALSAINVTPEATIATDGHRLAWVSGDGFKSESFPVVPNAAPATNEFKPFMVSAELAAKIAKATPTKEHIPVLNHSAIGIDGENRTIAVTDLESPQVFNATKQPDGQFPNTDAVIPRWEKATARFCVNAEYLADIAAFAAQFDRKRPVSIVVSLYEEQKAIRFDAEHDGQGYTAVLMPTRAHQTEPKRDYSTGKAGTPQPIEWIQPVNTHGYLDAAKVKADADACYELAWDAAHVEEIDRAWDAAHLEESDRVASLSKSYDEVRFSIALVGDKEPEPFDDTDPLNGVDGLSAPVEELSTTLYTNVPVSDVLIDKLNHRLQRDVAQGDGSFLNVYTIDSKIIGDAIHFLALYGVVVTEVSPEEHAPSGFIRNATPRERAKSGVPINVLDMLPGKIDARPVTSPNNTANRYMGPVKAKPNQSVIDAANAF